MSDAPMKHEDEITLNVLSSVHENHEVTQRNLANELGIALGLTNAYLKRCIRKGLIKAQQIPRNRYAYYLTAEGFSEKSRLTAQYLTTSFNFYRRARSQCEDIFMLCVENGWHRVALHSISDLTEIALLCANNHDVHLQCVIDPDCTQDLYHNVPVLADLPEQDSFDTIVITNLTNAQGTYDDLVARFPQKPILAPEFMCISKNKRDL